MIIAAATHLTIFLFLHSIPRILFHFLSLSLFSPSISISRTCVSLIHRIRTMEIQEIVFRTLRMKLRYFH